VPRGGASFASGRRVGEVEQDRSDLGEDLPVVEDERGDVPVRTHVGQVAAGILAEGPIERGELRRVLEGVLESPSQIAVVYPERELVPPQVRAFVNEVVAWAERTFASPPRRPPRPRSHARAR
jgi:hypothetical protein